MTGAALPALRGKAPDRQLLAVIDALVETVTIQQPAPDAEPGRPLLTRRSFLSGLIDPEAPSPPPRYRVIQEERRLNPAIRLALQQALILALAAQAGQPALDWLLQWQDRREANPLPLAVMTGRARAADAMRLRPPIIALDGSGQIEREVADGIRALKKAMSDAQAADYGPELIVICNGGLGKLEGTPNVGKLLGSLISLQFVAGDLPLTLVDPVLCDNAAEQAFLLAKVREFGIKRRVKRARIAVSHHATSVAACAALCQSEGVNWVVLHPARVGSLAEFAQIVEVCRQHGTKTMLAAGTAASQRNTLFCLQLGLATGVDGFVSHVWPESWDAPPEVGQVYHEMQRALTGQQHALNQAVQKGHIGETI
jgi:methylaspartate ammonia-lyase